MRRVFLSLVALLVLSAIAAGGVYVWGHAQFTRPGPLAAPVTIVIPKGKGLAAIAGRLTEAGVVANPIIFRLGARLIKADKGLQAGEYAFPVAISMREVLELLNSGKTVVRRFTVVEGMTAAKIVKLLTALDGLSGDIAQPPGEGELLPETYHFSYGDTRNDVVDRMAGAMTRTLRELWPARAPGLPLKNELEAVVLASMIEKETGLADERARVAAVFVNRLARGMRLQSDPTVVYALTEGKGDLGRTLTRADLKTPSPYNTYVNKGLPPAPICNPGRESLVAALHPAKTKELYFVADGSGGHLFASNLAQHNRNVARWRKIRKQQKK